MHAMDDHKQNRSEEEIKHKQFKASNAFVKYNQTLPSWEVLN